MNGRARGVAVFLHDPAALPDQVGRGLQDACVIIRGSKFGVGPIPGFRFLSDLPCLAGKNVPGLHRLRERIR